MTKIGLISDTHGYIDAKAIQFLEKCDEIWHAGDIGNLDVFTDLGDKPIKAVYGNIDGTDVRHSFPGDMRFMCEEVDVWITHIGGYPKKYDVRVREEIKKNPPKLFISGHSHILKVIYDKDLDLLHINPGAIGKNGFHKVRTAVRFNINGANIEDLEVLELDR